MKVYVLHKGVYDERHIAGIYLALESAKAAAPAPGWHTSDGKYWYNGEDWDTAADITEYEVTA